MEIGTQPKKKIYNWEIDNKMLLISCLTEGIDKKMRIRFVLITYCNII